MRALGGSGALKGNSKEKKMRKNGCLRVEVCSVRDQRVARGVVSTLSVKFDGFVTWMKLKQNGLVRSFHPDPPVCPPAAARTSASAPPGAGWPAPIKRTALSTLPPPPLPPTATSTGLGCGKRTPSGERGRAAYFRASMHCCFQTVQWSSRCETEKLPRCETEWEEINGGIYIVLRDWGFSGSADIHSKKGLIEAIDSYHASKIVKPNRTQLIGGSYPNTPPLPRQQVKRHRGPPGRCSTAAALAWTGARGPLHSQTRLPIAQHKSAHLRLV